MSRLPLVVTERIEEADDTVSLRLVLPAGMAEQFRYRPGQFVHIRGVADGRDVERSYSLSSAPAVDPFFQITVKRIEGGALSPILVDQIAPGDELDVSFPQGRFFEDATAAPHHYLLFGAGSGVTPLFSILKWVLARQRGDRVTLVFASRRETSMIFVRDLARIEQAYPDRFRAVHVLSQPSEAWSGESGRLDRVRLSALLRAHGPRDLPEIAYLCGPVPFMDEAEAALDLRGLSRRDIRRESFDVAEAMSATDLDEVSTVRILAEGPTDAGPSVACESLVVRIDGADSEIDLEPNETILAAILRYGLDAPFSCQEGTCLSCMCRVEDGAVRMKHYDLIGLTEADLGTGIALACLSRPDAGRVRLSFENV